MRSRILYGVFLLVVSFGATELLARALFPSSASLDRYLDELGIQRLMNSRVQFGKDHERYDELLGFRFSPNTVKPIDDGIVRYTIRTNSLGFRTDEIRPRQPGEYRVMLVGDSMMFGTGVEQADMIDSYLHELAETHGRNLSVYNFAVVGYNSVQETLVIENFLDDVDADHVVMGFFTANDVLSNAVTTVGPDGRYSVDQQAMDVLERDVRDLLSPLHRSAIYRIGLGLRLLPKLRYTLASRPEYRQQSLDWVRRARCAVEERGADFSLVVFHPKDAIRGGMLGRLSGSRLAGQRFVDDFRAEGIETLDVLDVLEGERDIDGLFLPDRHFSPRGNRRVAEAMWERLLPRIAGGAAQQRAGDRAASGPEATRPCDAPARRRTRRSAVRG